MDGPGIESRWGQHFPHLSRPALWPTQHPIPTAPGFFSRGQSGRGMTLTIPPSSSAEVKERVESHLFSLSGPSWLVYRANFTFTSSLTFNSSSKFCSKNILRLYWSTYIAIQFISIITNYLLTGIASWFSRILCRKVTLGLRQTEQAR